MEYISAKQLQKYDGIIEQINTEFEKHENLKKELEKENDNLILSKFANSTLTHKLCYLNVQIFDNFFDLITLYGKDIPSLISDIPKDEHSKFYLVEIYITKSLLQKAKSLKCILHVDLISDNLNLNKVLTLTSKTPIREIFLVDNYIINSTVEASLVLPSENKWICIMLDKICIDISYHFQMYNEKPTQRSKADTILLIANLYNKQHLDHKLNMPVKMQYKLFCDIEKDIFISGILKNCYHTLDMDLFLELKDDINKEFSLKLALNEDSISLIYNNQEKYLKVEANVPYLCLLKKYFFKEFYNPEMLGGPWKAKVPSDRLFKLENNDYNLDDFQDLCTSFREIRDTWSKLPI